MKFALLNEDDFHKIAFNMLDLTFRARTTENMSTKEDELAWCMHALHTFRGLIRAVGNMLTNKATKCCHTDRLKDS